VVDNQPSSANQHFDRRQWQCDDQSQTAMQVSPADLNRAAHARRASGRSGGALFQTHSGISRDTWAHLDFQLLHFCATSRCRSLMLDVAPAGDASLCRVMTEYEFRTALRSDNNMLLSRKVKPILELLIGCVPRRLGIPTLALCTKSRRSAFMSRSIGSVYRRQGARGDRILRG